MGLGKIAGIAKKLTLGAFIKVNNAIPGNPKIRKFRKPVKSYKTADATLQSRRARKLKYARSKISPMRKFKKRGPMKKASKSYTTADATLAKRKAKKGKIYKAASKAISARKNAARKHKKEQDAYRK